jgi:hypothetical protein
MIAAHELMRMMTGKKIFIWGAMIVGQGIYRALERVGVKTSAFLDRSPSLQGRTALGLPVLAPEDSFGAVRKGQGVIVAASGHCDLEIGDCCQQAGFQRNRDYVLCRDINDIDPSVDVSGFCNLKCISCPRGNERDQPAGGLMKASTYRKVLKKLLAEIPMLGSIQMYAWGEPLLNPDLPEIVEATRAAQVLSAISSNLNFGKHLESVISARPDWFKVSCSGWEGSYEITHTGGVWSRFLANLRCLADLRARLHPEMQVTVNYHLYKHNIGDDYRRMEALCNELDFIFRPSPAYLYPMDAVSEYVEGRPLSAQAQKTLPMLLMTLDEGLRRARERMALPCPEDRCFPIDWNCAVRLCGVYFRPFISKNFLEEPLEDILERKRGSLQCVRCRERGLHQFTGVYLEEKTIQDHS